MSWLEVDTKSILVNVTIFKDIYRYEMANLNLIIGQQLFLKIEDILIYQFYSLYLSKWIHN